MTNNEYAEVYNELRVIIDDDINLLSSYNCDKVISIFGKDSINLLINDLTSLISNNNIYYKYTNYWNLFVFIIHIINEYKSNTIDLNNFLLKLSILDKGQTLLEKLKYTINQQIKENILSKEFIKSNIITEVCLKGTLPCYFFWKEFIDDEILYDNYDIRLAYSCLNNDIRIFKYLINKENILNKYQKLDNENVINTIFQYLFDSRNSKKKTMKLLKYLNNYIQLDKYFENMIKNTTYGIGQYQSLNKYYHKKDLSFDCLYELLKHNNTDNIDETQKNYIDIYSRLTFPIEKCNYIIIKNLFFTNISNEEVNIINTKLFNKVIDDNRTIIISELSKLTTDIRHSNVLLKYIIQEYIDKSYFNEYINNYIETNNISNNTYLNLCSLWFYTKFMTFKQNKNIIKFNYILHKLRCKAKKIINKRKNEFKLKISPIINEIKNFLPNKRITILTKGSVNYQISKQKFTTLPPRHILPFEINYLENCLIKEKSDGINVKKLPNNIYPHSTIIENDIKAEYIEDLDLYLVYDINLPNMNIIERQKFLRNDHPYTQNLDNFQNINNLDELLCYIEYERNNIKQFLKSSNSDIKWYPKASFKITNFNKDFIFELNNYIEETNNKINVNLNENGIIKNDGLIITPLDGTQEIKIKPKSLLTIDLLFQNSNWIDSDNIKHDNIITNKTPKENKIYRCYPNNKNNMFEAKEVRYDKKRPNTNKICKMLMSIVKFDWLKNFDEYNIYYQKNEKITDYNISKILDENKNLFINYLKLLNPANNKYWLDLGCGKCKFFNQIKLYNPKKYTGIDIDIKNTIKTYKKYNEEHIFELYNCDLGSNWDNSNYKIYNIDYNIKYDYIICNFSLMHFSTDIFWCQLDKITQKGSTFVFNLTSENVNWNLNNSYLRSNNNESELYFEWIHSNQIKEKLITSSEIIKIINKYGWEIVNKIKYDNNLLIRCYDWYTIVKK
jgi:hypothetical protein